MTKKPQGRREILTEFGRYISQSIEAIAPNQLTAQQVEEIAERAISLYSSTFGGELVYIPKDSAFLRQKLHKEILAEFNGKNQRELAKKYGLSMQAIYKIIKAQIQRTKAEIYLAFDFDGEP